jgi:hypothetical protein
LRRTHPAPRAERGLAGDGRQTDGVAPREAAVDAVFQVVRAAAPADPIIFNCQMGAGRTTTGMVIACLTRTFTTGAAPGLMRTFMTGGAPCLARAGDRPARARAGGGAGGRRARPPAGRPQCEQGLPWRPTLARRRAATLRSPRPNQRNPLTGVVQRRLLFAGGARLRRAWRGTALHSVMSEWRAVTKRMHEGADRRQRRLLA